MNELPLTLGWVARAVGGRLRSGDAKERRQGVPVDTVAIGDVVIDSRLVRPGDLFVALRGPRFDGHDFVAEVLERGAVGAIVERGYAGSARRDPAYVGTAMDPAYVGTAMDPAYVGTAMDPADVGTARAEHTAGPARGQERRPGPAQRTRQGTGLIEVGDTLKALQDLAHTVRATAGTRVVAITGSAGKTTTKEAIASLLSTRARVVRNKGNLNNHVGLPLSLIELRTRPDVAVMELGMNHAGEISTLVAIAAPDVRVWTNVGDAHLGFFASSEAIADAKAEILELARPETVLVANADDPRVMARARGFIGRTLTFGSSPLATVRADAIEDRGIDGMRARIATPVGERRLETPLLGRGNLSNVLAATAVALNEGVPLDEIVAGVARLRPADRRGAVHHLRDGITLIDDSYNSSPAALRQALDVLAHATGHPRRVAIVGEMLELGDHSIALHQQCGRAAQAAGIAVLLAIGGPAARAMVDAARDAGMADAALAHFDTSEAAAAAAVEAIRPLDLVLVKGSRGIRTDVVADRLVAELG